jgi:ELMO/CED-12 family
MILRQRRRREKLSSDAMNEDLLQPIRDQTRTITFLSMVLDVLSTIYQFLLSILHVLSPPKLSLVQLERLEGLQKRLYTGYSAENPLHDEALKRLWDEVYKGSVPFPDTVASDLWKEFGWQGRHPSTDLRGSGMLAVECLLYYAEEEPESFHRVLKNSNHETKYYPFATAGCNIVFMLARNILDLQRNDWTPTKASHREFMKSLQDCDVAFEELFIYSFELLDEKWLHSGDTWTVMDWPATMQELTLNVESMLAGASFKIESERYY